MNPRTEFAAALVGSALGAAGALLIATRSWQTITAPRPRPLADAVVDVTGRTLQPAITAAALVALAGAVALLATRGIARRVVGAVVALAGALIVWRAAVGFAAMSDARARQAVIDRRSGVGLDGAHTLTVATHPVWPALTILCGVLVIAAGCLVAMRGAAWRGLSNRYEAPTAAAQRERATSQAGMWSALDRGIDPTDEPPADGAEPRAG